MEISNLRNMVILKNLPSNIVEEAIVVLKENQKIKKKEYIDNGKKSSEIRKDDREYIVNEARLVISDCINNLEKKNKKEDNNIQKKYKRIQYINYGLIGICFLQFIILII